MVGRHTRSLPFSSRPGQWGVRARIIVLGGKCGLRAPCYRQRGVCVVSGPLWGYGDARARATSMHGQWNSVHVHSNKGVRALPASLPCKRCDPHIGQHAGLFRELNPGPLAPEAKIIPLDQTARCTASICSGAHGKLHVHVQAQGMFCVARAQVCALRPHCFLF